MDTTTQDQSTTGQVADAGRQVAATGSDQAKQVASDARERAGDVAHTAADNAQSVANEAREQAAQLRVVASRQLGGLVDEARANVRQQAKTQADGLSEAVGRLSGQVRALTEGHPDQAGPVGDYARQATARLDDVAGRLRSEGFDGFVRDVTGFARRRPGAFLAGAAGAGFLLGRLLRASRDGQSSGGSSDVPMNTPAPDPAGLASSEPAVVPPPPIADAAPPLAPPPVAEGARPPAPPMENRQGIRP